MDGAVIVGDSRVDALVIENGAVRLDPLCPDPEGKIKGARKGTKVRAKWASCPDVVGKVQAKGRIDPACAELTATIRARKAKVKEKVAGTRSSCGDGRIDAGRGEDCEPPGTASCDAECHEAGTLDIAITSPANLTVFGAARVEIAGTVVGGEVVACDGDPATVEGTAFTATVMLDEGNNSITCTVEDQSGAIATATVTLTLDTEPPALIIQSPKPDAALTSAAVTVAGVVHDIVVGTVNEAQATVECNGTPAQVANRTFVVANLPLAAGANTITCVATDQAGNDRNAAVTVTRQSASGPEVQIVAGNNQSAMIGTVLANPLVVRVVDDSQAPVVGQKVTFRVIENDGLVDAVRAVVKTTDGAGQASVLFRTGTRAGAGNQQVRAGAVGYAGEAMFTASAATGPPARIVVDAGLLQTGAAGRPLPRPFVASVIDGGNNRLAGVPVTFTVVRGGGNLAAVLAQTVETDGDGRALVVLTLGPEPGLDNNVVEATFADNAGASAVFAASAQVPGDPAATRITGVVVDNTNVPIEGVTVGVVGTSLLATTDAEGQFVIAPAPIGDVELLVDGTTAVREGSWPRLTYDLVTVPGQDNTIGMPIPLPQENVAEGVFVDDTHGGTVTLAAVPGFGLEIAPGSATFPNGGKSGVVTVTAVHPDKVPMPPQYGQQPRFVVSIQPARTRFSPPAALTLPNSDALPPGQKTEMYSFDHDLTQFVAIGTGTVSADGSVVRSDPGVGVITGGWHCGGNPAGTGTCDHQCDDGNDCTEDSSSGGSCQHTPKPNGTPCTPAPDTLACGGGVLAMVGCGTGGDGTGNGGGQCQGGACQEPAGKPKAGDVFKAMQQTCMDLSQPDGGCAGAVGQAMLAQLGNLGGGTIACMPPEGCTPPNPCACTTLGAQINIIDPTMCKGASLERVLRHEMQHLLCGTDHTGAPRQCANDPTFACDQQCGLDPAAEGRCEGTVDPSACVPTGDCQ